MARAKDNEITPEEDYFPSKEWFAEEHNKFKKRLEETREHVEKYHGLQPASFNRSRFITGNAAPPKRGTKAVGISLIVLGNLLGAAAVTAFMFGGVGIALGIVALVAGLASLIAGTILRTKGAEEYHSSRP